jgi:4-hydroxybenzoyl-CoA reductase subunit beta
MMRLPRFEYYAPRSLAAAADLLGARPATTMILAGGTDLLPNMKRRQQTPEVLVSLRQIAELRDVRNGTGLSLGSALTLSELVRMPTLQRDYAGLWQAAAQIATPHLRAMGTLGGNLCLDTRCNYYDQTYEWRKSIDFCMKKDGRICWVATSSPTCLAVSSTDTAPALISLGASVRLVSASGERTANVADLYNNDGIHYLTRQPDEILADIRLPASSGWRSTYWKLRRRGSFDFPVLSVAAAAAFDGDTVKKARIVLGAVASRPIVANPSALALRGRRLTDDVIAEAADA